MGWFGKWSGLTLISALCCGTGQVGQATTLDWESCLNLARGSHPALKTADAVMDSAKQKIDAADADFRPTVTASANVDQTRDFTDDAPPSEPTGALSINVRQSIYSGHRSEANLDRARLAAKVAEFDAEQAEIQLTYDLRRAFEQVLYYQELAKVNERAAQRRGQNLAIVKLRYDSGRENKGSYLKAEAAHLQAETELSQTRRNLEVVRAQLGRLIGEPIAAETLIQGELRAVVIPAQTPDFVGLAQRSLVRRRGLASVDMAAATLAAEKAAYHPELAATASAVRGPSELPPEGARLSVGLSLTMTLYDGGKTPANVRGAAADLARSQYELAESDQTSLGNLQLAYASLLDGKERVDLAAKQLAASQLQAQTTRDLYTLGLSAFQQWDQIENELIANEKSRIGSRRDAALALTEWERLLGREFKGVEP